MCQCCWPTQTYIQKILQKNCFCQCFYMFFRQKRRNLHVSVQNTGFCSVFKALASKNVKFRDLPKPLKTPLSTLFSSIFPRANAGGQLKHIFKKSFKHIVFVSVFTCFSVKDTVMYTFFGTGFCSVFNALASKNLQNIAIYSVFSFLSVFPLPEADQNDSKFHFNGLFGSDTKISSKKRADTTNTRSWCEIAGLGAKSFLHPSPPAKGDIATAILTNVIKHLV